jgi:hypothetical protein
VAMASATSAHEKVALLQAVMTADRWSHFGLLRLISGGPEAVGVLLGRELVREFTNGLPECLLGTGGCLVQQRLELGEKLLDRVEVGPIGGRRISVTPVASMSARAAVLLCGGKLSMITTSPGPIVGARTCSMYAARHGLVIGPSSAMGAVNPLRCPPATKVVVFQCPCGMPTRRRCPRAASVRTCHFS